MLLAITSGITLLLFLIIRFKFNAFLSLLIASIWIGLVAGISPDEIAVTIGKGMGDTLGFVATIVGLGAIFGALLEHSGGAEQLAHYLLKKTGEAKAKLALLVTGFLVSIPVFFDVAIIILIPIIRALSHRTKKSVLFFALPLMAGIGVTHSFIPPTPGPVAVADILGVELGWMILIGAIVGLPTAIICGLFISSYLSRNSVYVEQETEHLELNNADHLAVTTIFAILLPLILMIGSAVMKTLVDGGTLESNYLIEIVLLVGHPFGALIIATGFAMYFLGTRIGLDRDQLFKISDKSLAPAGTIILITGAGGVLKQMLITTGIGNLIAEAIAASSISTLFLAFALTGLVRALQGSATIAMITGAGIMAPVLSLLPDLTMIDKTLVALSIASGSVMASHVNDSGFWLVNRYLEQSVTETLRSWTVLSTCIAIVGFLMILIVSLFI